MCSGVVKTVKVDDSYGQLETMYELYDQAKGALKDDIKNYISMLEFGQLGEKCVREKLMSSDIPMVVLEGLTFGHGKYTAQIDFVVVTDKVVFFIECKSMVGNINIDKRENFKRVKIKDGFDVYERISSPKMQNERHLNLFRDVLEVRKEEVAKVLKQRSFDRMFKSLIVFTNPRSEIEMDGCSRGTRSNVLKLDQLLQTIRKSIPKSSISQPNMKRLQSVADGLLKLHYPDQVDYTAKYKEGLEAQRREEEVEREKILKAYLDEYRNEKSIEYGIQPHFVLSEKQIEAVVSVKPKELKHLNRVLGFDRRRVSRYGMDIVGVVNKFSQLTQGMV